MDKLREALEQIKRESARDQVMHDAGDLLCKVHGIAEAVLSNQPEQAPWEHDLREWLWIAHGHGFGYGDDGEMQCSQCKEWDYKRAPLNVLIPQALKAQKEAALAKLHEAEAAGKAAGKP